jgi:hypothetical protein
MAINPETGEEYTPLKENLYNKRGGASSMSDKYSVSMHSYPKDLISNTGEYGGNYAIFYINVQTDSKLAKTADESEFVNDNTPRDRGDLIAQNLSSDKLLATNLGLLAGGAILGKALGVGAVAGPTAGLAAVGAYATSKVAATASRAQRRLKTAIALHIPNQLQIRYGMQWGDQDTGALAMAAVAGEQAVEIAKALMNKDSVNTKDVGDIAAAMGTNLALSKGPFASANSAATGLAANPKKEQVFSGVDFRTFQVEYQFFPRSVDEARNVQRIIYEFKYHMHPEFKDANNFVYIYPSEFDIFYYQNGTENLNLHRHTSCVLTEMSVNYTPNGVFSTFDNGMPTQINVQMSFRELALLTKDKIKDGL